MEELISHYFQHVTALRSSPFCFLWRLQKVLLTHTHLGGKNRTAVTSFHQLLSPGKSCVLPAAGERPSQKSSGQEEESQP